MAPTPKKNPPKKPIGIGTNPNTGTTTFGGRTVNPKDPRRDPASGSNSFDNPLNNRGPAKPDKPMPSPMLGKTGQWIDKTFGGKGGDTKKQVPVGGPVGPKRPITKKDLSPAAAAAVVNVVGRLNNQVGSAMDTVKFGGKSGGSTKTTPTPAASSSAGGSGGGGSSKPTPPKSGKPPKPGRVYNKTRAAWKSEKDNQPRTYEPPEQRAERLSKSQFDMDMSGAEVKKLRKAYLKSHPAAAKAVAKGTLSMGDINMTVRRLKKKNPGALGLKTEDG